MKPAPDDEGMRIIRGKGHRPRLAVTPVTLLQVAAGRVVFIPVRVCAHFAGPGKGPYTDVLARAYDLDAHVELYGCGDIYVARAGLVEALLLEDEP